MKTILLVEDDADLRDLMAHLLERAGYHVWQAGNGEEALRVLEGPDAAPALVLLDLMMPVMSGQEVLQALALFESSPPPVIVLSAVADRQRPPGAVAYLRKPVTETELLQSVQHYAS